MGAETKFYVGQKVWHRLYNGRETDRERDRQVTVSKVGRTLVYVELYGPGGRAAPYRIETGYANDDYGHSRILTDEDRDRIDAERTAREALLNLQWRPPASATLEQMQAVLAALQ